jgi:anti-sigma factor RsiW
MKSNNSKMRCNTSERDINRYLDNALTEQQQKAVADHLRDCSVCAAKKKELESIRVLLKQVPEVVPSRDAERRLWEMIEKERLVGVIAHIRSWLTVWDLVPTRFLGTAAVVLGIIIGIGIGTMSSGSRYDQSLDSAAATYFVIHYSDPVPYGSFAAAYRDSFTLGVDRPGDAE